MAFPQRTMRHSISLILATLTALSASEVRNVALSGEAYQSSTYNPIGIARNAIDGSLEGDFSNGSCTHTNNENNPWWIVDLLAEYDVFSVSITNRQDCCSYRIEGAEIRVGNSIENGGTTNPRCATVNVLALGQTQRFHCEGFRGQFVTVNQPMGGMLTLCEVQVFGQLTEISDDFESERSTSSQPLLELDKGEHFQMSVPNVAPKGKVFQSSTYNVLGDPENAVDGSIIADYMRGHCTHTEQEVQPWWTVDLTAEFQISRVSITNREDCCAERLNGAVIHIGNSPEKGGITNPRCATISSLGQGKTAVFDCGEMQGQYVTVTIPGVRMLTLCEVQVFGTKVISSGLDTANETEAMSGRKEEAEVTSAIAKWTKPRKLPNLWEDSQSSLVVRNVAINGQASQSTSYNSLSSPEHAIDGSTDSNFLLGHCTHTKLSNNPWWMVDLRGRFRVLSIVVTNRGDCCEERIKGAEIRIGDSKARGGTSNPRCAIITSLGLGETGKYECDEMPGQYVTITIPQRLEYLSLCEVQVYGQRIIPPVRNVAYDGKAYESSSYDSLSAPEHAIDGSTDAYYLRGHCTHTKLEVNPWWMVDLRARFRVLSVAVTNRGDCCEERIEGAEIRIGDSKERGGITNPRCATITSLGPGETHKFECGEMPGQYVTITIPDTNSYLTVCEVQVFAERIIPPVPNVALKGKAFQSSLYHKLGLAEHAIDGSTAVDYYRGSCTHTELEANPWWMVDLGAEFNVTSVSISNREDCCADRLNVAEIRIGNSEENGGLINPRCAVITAIGPGETENFDCKGMKGRYVTVTIPRVQYLTLCEVQVFGVKADSSETQDV
nr:uncharacterized protein LOC132776031 [Anolis sagrei ordinatus]